MRVTLAAGGTGGHLFPAEALAAALERRGHAVSLMTDARTAARAGDRFGRVQIVGGAGLVGKSALDRVGGIASLAAGTLAARRHLDADAVVAFGGYPSVPPVLASVLRRRRPVVVLHDQNAVLGRANRFLARFADAVATSFDAVDGVPAGTRQVLVGNPVRPAIAAIGRYEPPGATCEILVLGGSLGARVFSDVVPAALAALGRPLRVSQQARPEDVARVEAAYRAAGIEADIRPFFDDVASRLARAHLVIARSGGSTVAELTAAGRPAILVPLPIAAGDEQSANARVLVDAGAATMAKQADFTTEFLIERLRALLASPSLLADAADRARALGRTDAADRLVLLVEDLASTAYDVKRPIRQAETRIGA